jgi:hypothetical protein
MPKTPNSTTKIASAKRSKGESVKASKAPREREFSAAPQASPAGEESEARGTKQGKRCFQATSLRATGCCA